MLLHLLDELLLLLNLLKQLSDGGRRFLAGGDSEVLGEFWRELLLRLLGRLVASQPLNLGAVFFQFSTCGLQFLLSAGPFSDDLVEPRLRDEVGLFLGRLCDRDCRRLFAWHWRGVFCNGLPFCGELVGLGFPRFG